MRSRNVKPGFFKNEALSELSHQARLFFIGLWCYADRDGKMIFSPKRIKAELFPYEDADCTVLAQCLSGAGMVQLYEHSGTQYLKVLNFTKHQNPHMNEKSEGYPDSGTSTVLAPELHRTSTVPIGPLKEGGKRKEEVPNTSDVTMPFDQFWDAYPAAGRNQRSQALQAFKKVRGWEIIGIILEALEVLKKSKKWQDGSPPWALSFLEGRQWEGFQTAKTESHGPGRF